MLSEVTGRSVLVGCRGLDPIGDTERGPLLPLGHGQQRVAEGSIRLGILKEWLAEGWQWAEAQLQRARSDWGY